MKKLVFGLIATVMFSTISFSQDFDAAGLAHNSALKNILSNYDKTLTKENVVSKTMEQLKKSMTDEEFKDVFVFKSYTDPYSMLQELKSNGRISEGLYSLVFKDISEFQNTYSTSDVNNIVERKRDENRNLSATDEKIYLSYLSVAKHSSEFWDPNMENGIKYLFFNDEVFIPSTADKGPHSILNYNIRLNSDTEKINWRKVFICDMIGDICSGFNPLVGAGASAISAVNQSDLP
jgi:hypothetical protein